MLNKQDKIVLDFLKNHFANSNKSLVDFEIYIYGLNSDEIIESLYNLERYKEITAEKYIHLTVTGIND